MAFDKKTIRKRLKGRIQIDKSTGCHVYCGAWTARGFARMKVGHSTYSIQRVVLWLSGKVELWERCYRYRTCTTPACCNAKHIAVAASFAAALPEMRRLKLFSLVGKIKLTKRRRACIRVLAEEGVPAAQIAADLGMRTAKIQCVIDDAERPSHAHDRPSRKDDARHRRKPRVS